jgi:hypothetical protein
MHRTCAMTLDTPILLLYQPGQLPPPFSDEGQILSHCTSQLVHILMRQDLMIPSGDRKCNQTASQTLARKKWELALPIRKDHRRARHFMYRFPRWVFRQHAPNAVQLSGSRSWQYPLHTQEADYGKIAETKNWTQLNSTQLKYGGSLIVRPFKLFSPYIPPILRDSASSAYLMHNPTTAELWLIESMPVFPHLFLSLSPVSTLI